MKKTILLVTLAVVIASALVFAFPVTRGRLLDASIDTGEAAEFYWHRLTTFGWAKVRHLSVTNSVTVLGPFGRPYTVHEYGTPATNKFLVFDEKSHRVVATNSVAVGQPSWINHSASR